MNPATIIALLNAAMSMTEELLPLVTEAAQKGEISPEQQAKVLARYQSLKNRAEGQFSGLEWKAENA